MQPTTTIPLIDERTVPALGEEGVLFIGNATLLIREAGFTILTDPNFIHAGEKVSLGPGMSATRIAEPAMECDDLPPIDFVLLSHFHGDHFDQLVEERLDRGTLIVTNSDAAEKLAELGFVNVHVLAGWATLTFTRGASKVAVTATPARHGPAVVSFAVPEVTGSYLEFEDGLSGERSTLYVTGDTVMYDGIEEVARRLPRPDAAAIHLGGTKVLGFTLTMDAEQGVEFVRVIQPVVGVPIHFDDYDAFASPLRDFQAAVQAAGLEKFVRYVQRGGRFSLREAARVADS